MRRSPGGPEPRRIEGRETGINRLLSRLRHLFNWAIGGASSSIRRSSGGPVTVVKIDRSIEYARTQRLDAAAGEEHNEERRLLDHADAHLRAVLVASRLLESSADLHDVQMFLGHADITTTSRYLQSTPVRLARALAKLEGN